MITPPDRRFRLPWLILAVLLTLAVGAARPAAAAGTLVGISMSAQPGVTASGELGCCKQQQMSADGRWVVFRSYGRELINGYTGDGFQIYLFDRQTGQVRLVSGAGGSPTQGAAGAFSSKGEVVSADGAFVAFESSATDLVAGGSGSGSINVYFWERATGRVILVSHSAAAAGQRGNNHSWSPMISADGAFVAFESSATDLVAGGSGPGSPNVYLWERATGTVTLVSESTTATGQRGNNQSFTPKISADGAFVAFTSEATDLVAGGSGPGTRNVYLWERATGTATLVSESTAAAGQRSSGGSPAISGNGAFVAFLSSATDLVAGGSGPVKPNVYLWERATGTVTLVSESTTAAGQRANNQSFEPVISGDGAFVAFSSFATDLVAGGSGPVNHNIYLWERATSTATLVSHSAATTGQRGNNLSFEPVISADGAFVAFPSSATDLVAGGSGPGTRNVYRWERATGAVTLVSESTAAAGQRGDNSSSRPAISGDGAFVAFQSDATDLVANDPHLTDVLVAEVATGGRVVASRRAPDIPWFPRTANNPSSSPSMSGDGAFVAFTSSATDLVAAGSSGPVLLNVYLWERATGIVTLVSHAAAAAGQRGNNHSSWPVISADGAFVTFYSRATDLVAGSSGPAVENIYLWERATGIVTLVSHAAAAAGQRSHGLYPVISAAGDFVAFLGSSTDLIAGGSGPGTENVYLWERATGTVTLVSESAAVAGQRGNANSFPTMISTDGAFVAFSSNATDLVSGGGPATSNVYLYERTTGSLTLVSGSTAVAGQRGNGQSSGSVISANGAFVAFYSDATDLVLGGSGAATVNVYLWERATGTATLVSQSIFLPGRRGNNSSLWPVITPDGAFVAFTSSASDLVAGGSGPEADNVYLWQRGTGTVTLISESTAAAGQRGNDRSGASAISADGAFVAVRSLATDLVAGGSGPATGRPDGDLPPPPPLPFNVYLWERATGAVTLVSHSAAGQRGNSQSSGPVMSADGAFVAFSSLSSNLIAGDLSSQSDVFHWSVPPLFADGFESGDTVRWSGSTNP